MDGSAGARPVCSSSLTAAVRTSARAGDAGSSAASAIRGRPRRSEPVEDDRPRLRLGRSGDVGCEPRGACAAVARRRPSRRTRACGSEAAPAPTPVARSRARARSGRPCRLRSRLRNARCRRCHDGRRARSPRSDRPGTTVTTLRSSTRRARTRSCAPDVLLDGRSPATRSSRGTSAQRPPPRRYPGRATGTRSSERDATSAAAGPSKSGSRAGCGRTPVVETENSIARSGRGDDDRRHTHEARVDEVGRRCRGAAAASAHGAEPLPSRGYSRRAGSRGPCDRSHVERLDHPPRRRRGLHPDASHVSPRAGRLSGRPGARRRGRAPTLRRGGRGPRRPRRHAPAAGRPRGLQAATQPRAPCRSSC